MPLKNGSARVKDTGRTPEELMRAGGRYEQDGRWKRAYEEYKKAREAAMTDGDKKVLLDANEAMAEMKRHIEHGAKDSELKPIPVDDQVLGHGAVGDASSYNDLAQAYHAAHKAWHNSGSYSNEEKTAYKQMEEIGKKLAAHPDNPRNKPAAKVAAAAQAAREHQDWKDSMHSRIASGEVRRGVRGYDAGLLPIPVNDTEWNDPKPRGSYKLTTSAALKTPSAVASAYKPNTAEGMKRSFSKDAEVKPIRVNPAPMAKLIPVSKRKAAKDSNESEAKQADQRDAKVIKAGLAAGLTAAEIARKNGFPLQFVKDVEAGKFKAGAKDLDTLEMYRGWRIVKDAQGYHGYAANRPELHAPRVEQLKAQIDAHSGGAAKDAESKKPVWQADSPNQEKLNGLHREMNTLGYKYKYSAGTGKEMQHHYAANGTPGVVIYERKNGNHGAGKGSVADAVPANDCCYFVMS